MKTLHSQLAIIATLRTIVADLQDAGLSNDVKTDPVLICMLAFTF